MIILAIGAAGFFLAAMAAFIVFLRVGIGREERDQSLRGRPATNASAITRRLVGLHVRTPRYVTGTREPAGQGGGRPATHPCTTGQGR